MENQHRKITGYRDLTQVEIDLLNEIKARSEEVGALIYKIRDMRVDGAGIDRFAPPPTIGPLNDPRWVAIAQTQIQQGFMALARAVAKPTTF